MARSKQNRVIPSAQRRRKIEIARARQDPNAFMEYVFRVRQDPVHRAWQRLWQTSDSVIHGSVGLGKCLPAGTPVLVESGEWRPIERVSTSDRVHLLDPSCMQLRTAGVAAAFECGEKQIVRLSLRSGRTIEVGEEHPLFTISGWTRAGELQTGQFIASARQLPAGTGAIDIDEAGVLGLLVGDGGTKNGVTLTNIDPGVLAYAERVFGTRGWTMKRVESSKYGYSIGRPRRTKIESARAFCRRHKIACLAITKRAPAAIMAASNDAVAEFIGAYFACDGHVGPSHLEIGSGSRGLLLDVQLLLRRFGIVSWLREHPVLWEGRWLLHHRLTITAASDIDAFRWQIPVPGEKADRLAAMRINWPRKPGAGAYDIVPRGWEANLTREDRRRVGRARIDLTGKCRRGRHRLTVRRVAQLLGDRRLTRLSSNAIFWDEIASIERVGSAPCFDIEVDHRAHCYLADGFLSHNSVQARGHVLWQLGNHPDEQVIWLGATQRQPRKNLHAISSAIETTGPTSRLHHVFPHLRPGKVWRSTEIEVLRDGMPADADPSISVYGAYSDSVLGSRATRLVIDDLCTWNNTLTDDSRAKMVEWLGSVISRLTKRRVRIMVIGNFWHKDDATSVLARKKGFRFRRDPAYRIDPDTGERIPTAPECLPLDMIQRLEDQLGPISAERMLLCRAAEIDIGRFKRKWFADALEAGRGEPFRPARASGAIYTGVDLGHTKKLTSARTAMVTAMITADGHKQLLDVRSGRWDSGEISSNLDELRARYNPIIGVENNAAQHMVIELISDLLSLPMYEHNTGINKYHAAHGIEGCANELRKGIWIFPCPDHPTLDRDFGLIEVVGEDDDEDDLSSLGWTLAKNGEPDPEIQGLVNEAMLFDPNKHPGDRLMAWWICNETMRNSSAGALLGDVQSAADFASIDIFSR